MELEKLTPEELKQKIEWLSDRHKTLNKLSKPYEVELAKRERLKYIDKYFLDTTSNSLRYIHVLSADVDKEFGWVTNVRSNSIQIWNDGKFITIAKNAEELNYRYTCVREITSKEYQAAITKVLDFTEGL